MLENGFIKLHRKITNWEWYKSPNTLIVFLHLILTANYEPQKFQGELIGIGEKVTSFSKIAAETGLSVQSVRTAINHLKSTNEITSRTNHQYTVFTVVNYRSYQDRQQTKQQTPNKRPTNAQQTINNNERKNKKDKKARMQEEREKSPRPARRRLGSYGNVLLSDDELQKLRDEIANTDEYIERLSEYMASNGKRYKSHLATIRSWARRDGKLKQQQDNDGGGHSYSLDSIENFALNYGLPQARSEKVGKK